MAQADQTVQNATFPTVRADINSNLAALFSNSSGTTAPTTTVAYMDWLDTSGVNPIWKKRNAANNAWITVATIIGNTISFEGTLPSQSGQSGKYLTTNGTVASWATITAGGQLLRAPQILTTGTSYTAPANCTSIYVEAVGGGGGGGVGSGTPDGGGGGAGGYAAKFFAVTALTSYTYAIGAAGTGATAFGNGTGGGNTTFTVGATTITAPGGSSTLVGSTGGDGGKGSNGDVNGRGESGVSGTNAASGRGGDSFFGFGGDAGLAGSSGGGGGGSVSTAAGDGGTGLIRIWEYS